jgi:hypothetical protein
VSTSDGFALELADVDVERLEFEADLGALDLASVSGAQATAELATSCLYACSCCVVCCCCCGLPG